MDIKGIFKSIESLLPKFRINKYTIAGLAFIVWISFFDKHNLINQNKLSTSITELESEVVSYNEAYQVALQERADLQEDKEKYAREHHNFTGENEELFIIKGKK